MNNYHPWFNQQGHYITMEFVTDLGQKLNWTTWSESQFLWEIFIYLDHLDIRSLRCIAITLCLSSSVICILFSLVLFPFLSITQQESGTRKTMSWSVTLIVQNLPFDCCRIKKTIYIYIYFLITVPTRPTSGKPHRPPTIDDGADYTKKTSYTCENCDKMYSKAKDLEIHMSYCTSWKNTYVILY